MSTFQIQRRGGSSSAHSNFTGAARELTIDTTNWNIRVHDGTTAGGNKTLMEEDLENTIWDSGTSRPSSPVTGRQFFDTSLGQPIWWNGNTWVDGDGTSV